MISSTLSKWVPYKLLPDAHCRWLHIGDIPFAEPFFSDTIGKCRSATVYRQHSVSSLELLPDWAANIPSVHPSAFIFHISRCGSTLLSQLLGIDPQHIVLSEVPFFDEVLRAPFNKQLDADFTVAPILEAAIRFYAQKRTGYENRLFIKTDSWHVFFHRALRELYPGVPFILLYRKPEEVIRSQQKKRGMQAVPGVVEREIFRFDKEEPANLDEYMAHVMERYLTLFLDIAASDPQSLLVNYNDGMLNVFEQMAAFTDLDISANDHAKMEARCRYHAKYPGQVFTEQHTEMNIPLYLQNCIDLYRQLEQKRLITALL